MNKILSFILVGFTIFTVYSQNGDQAKKLLDEVSTNMNAYENMYIKFDYILENKEADVEQVSSGDITLQKEKYIVNIFGTTKIYDGKLSYSIIPENEEVNISSDNVDDSESIAPSKFINFYKSGYTFSMGESKSLKGVQIQFVKLVPIDTNSEIKSVIVGVDKNKKQIYSVKQIGENGVETTIVVNKIKVNQKLKNNFFSFDQGKYERKNYTINR